MMPKLNEEFMATHMPTAGTNTLRGVSANSLADIPLSASDLDLRPHLKKSLVNFNASVLV